MKVCLISAPFLDWKSGELVATGIDAERVVPPTGVYALAAVLIQAGHHARVLDMTAAQRCELTEPGEHEALRNAGLVGISATSMSWPAAIRLVHSLRTVCPDVPVVVGGVHASMFDDHILESLPVQFVVRGEGELAILALTEAIEGLRPFADVPNLTWRDAAGSIVRNPTGGLLGSGRMEEFPVGDYSQLPQGVYGALAVESARGCSFDCVFCSTPYRKGWRSISAEAFVDRLHTVMQYRDRVRSDIVYIVDDEFAMNPRRVMEISRCLARRGLEPRLIFDLRAKDLLFDGFIAAIQPFTEQFLVGAECGYAAGLERVGKGVTIDQLEQAAVQLKAAGLAERVDYSFVIGFPWETVNEVEETVRFAGRMHATYGVNVLLQWYYQLPGSRIWDEAERAGLVHPSMYDEFGLFTTGLHLFRTANRLTVEQIQSISHKVATMVDIARLNEIVSHGRISPNRKLIDYHHPAVIEKYFPRKLNRSRTALESLRDIQKPGRVDQALHQVN